MAEPTLPAPRWFLEDLAAGRTSGRDEARTLLSQPTPTAERWQDRPHEVREDVGDYSMCLCGSPVDASLHDAAAPPSIADMVPGTTFSFLRVDGVRVRGFVIDGHITIDVEGSAWRHDEIDPSTIRDVTVPTVTP